MKNVIHRQQGDPVRLSTLFNQCGDKGSRIGVECPGGKWGDSEGGIVAGCVTPSKAPTVANLPLEARPEVTTRQSTTLTAVGTKRRATSQMRQTTLSQCQPYHVRREARANYKERNVADGRCVHAAAPTCKGVPHKKLKVPSEIVVTPAQRVAHCSEAHGGALKRQKDMESADKTSTTDDDSNVQTVGTDAGWSDKDEDDQGRTRAANAARAADGDAWDKHALLPSKASLAANLATREECFDLGAAGNGAQGSDGSSGSTNSSEDEESSSSEDMGDSVCRSSSIDSNKSVLLPTDESFPSASDDASLEDSNDDWVAMKTRRPTAALRRNQLTGEAAGLSHVGTTRSVAPEDDRQDITNTNTSIADEQFLRQFDPLYETMHGKNKYVERIIEKVEEHYGWSMCCDQKIRLIEKHAKELRDQTKASQLL